MNRIAQLRRDKGATQKDLADLLHVSQGTISKWENDTHHPDYESLFLMADYFDVGVDYLLGYTDGKSPVIRRMLQEYIANKYHVRIHGAQLSIIDDILCKIVNLVKNNSLE